jgi:DNA-binding LacI/PurR family transcriptional regulator
MALIVPDSGAAGDLISEKGFREGIAHRIRDDARVIIVRHNGSRQNLFDRLTALFTSNNAPTALLVAKPKHVIMVMIFLLKRGLTVPDTVSLIARDYDYLFETGICHYTLKPNVYARRLSRLILQMVKHGGLAAHPNLIFPKYFAGTSIKTIPSLSSLSSRAAVDKSG